MSDQSSSGNDIALLKQLIKCPSVTPKEAGALDAVEAFLTPLGFTCTRLVFDGDGSYPVDNLFATRGDFGRHILFAGHTDVVPPGDEELWSHKPFSADEADGQIWGRGAVDMKSGVACFCAAAELAVKNGDADKGIISLAITNDEEADSVNGSDKLLKWAAKQGHKFDFAIVGEPSSARVLGDNIKIGRRGSISGIVSIKGKQGHSAYPERAANPVPVLADLALLLSNTRLDDGTEHFQASNLEVVSIDVGNKATNVIPASGQLSFNIRFNDLWNQESMRAWIGQRVGQVEHDGFEISWQQVTAVAQSFVSPVSDDVIIVQNAVNAITGQTPDLATFGGTSDARFIASYCPVVECGLVGATMHQVDERVEIDQVEKLTKIYAGILSNFF
ncbi:N-succinyl-L,L-diaminopimelate desuccinylase [hydrothermal vent metagenome]|uniref:Succinyl-diaminopimelate desuccinylase n=1 Tax=hydrothermal vent metagenome TaxID=652676 RepID=A0A3B0TQG2_9ZZZZ